MRQIVIAVALVFLCACTAQHKMSAPEAGVQREVWYDNSGNIIKLVQTSSAVGPEIDGNGSDIQSPEIKTTPDSATIGESGLEIVQIATSMRPLYIAGAAIIVLSIMIGYFVSIRLAVVGGLCGLGIIVVTKFLDTYPLLAMVLMSIFGLGALGYAIYTGRLGEQAKKSLRAIVPAIDSLGTSERELVTEAIAKTAKAGNVSKVVKDTVTDIKRAN